LFYNNKKVGIKELLDEYKRLEDNALVAKSKMHSRIIKQYESSSLFLKSLRVHLINKSNNKDFRQLYDFYTSFFTLPEETESYEGFEKTLLLNSKVELQQKYGRFEEAWIYVKDAENNTIIGGINFSIYLPLDAHFESYALSGTAHIIYIFVKPEYRSLGVAHYLLSLAEAHVATFAKSKYPLLYFCEQNAPELMTAESYFNDNINALVDQCDRLVWWDKLGYKRLAFNYVQPPLNIGQEACVDLTLNVKSTLSSIPTQIVLFHLERFFDLAVFKAHDNLKDQYYYGQINWLQNNSSIKTTGDADYYNKLKQKMYKAPHQWQCVEKLFKI